MGFEPMNTGFADQHVSYFAIGACQTQRKGRDKDLQAMLMRPLTKDICR